MKWEPIAELGDWQDLASKELPPLASVWEEQRQSLDAKALKDFNDRLAREWSIETGILERLYTIDRGTTQLLIERGFDSSIIPHDNFNSTPEKVAAHLLDHQDTVEWLFEIVKSERPFSESFIKEMHSLIVRSQKTATGIDPSGRSVEIPLRRGAYKLRSNNPIRPDGVVHEYCPHEQVTVEMERLVEWYLKYQDNVPTEVLSAWVHHRFTQIHPFQDGNGRVARALSTLVFIKAGWFPLVINRDQRREYLDALERADNGDLSLLVELFVSTQRNAFVNALGIARDVKKASEFNQLYEAIGDQFRKRDKRLAEDRARAKKYARSLWKDAGGWFQDAEYRLKDSLNTKENNYRRVYSDKASPDDTYRRNWNRWQVVKGAKDLRYFANLSDFSAWQRIVIDTEGGRSEIFLSFHVVGKEFRGIIGVSLVFYRKNQTDTGQYTHDDHHTVSKTFFQINYRESLEDIKGRFKIWFEKYLLQALDLWLRGE